MRYGVWTPLPHTIRPEPAMNEAMRESGTRGAADGPDKAFRFAVDLLRRAEQLGFETTLLAERWIGTDHPAWMLASALAPLTSRIELMVAVHPGIITPQVVAKFAASLDRLSGGRAAINIVNGWWKEEFETFGNGAWPPDDPARYRRMDEFVRVMRGLWNEDAFDFHGEFYTVDRQGRRSNPYACPIRHSMPGAGTIPARTSSRAIATAGSSTVSANTGSGSKTSRKPPSRYRI
jgi:FMNH2-dependent dimethyl sulfone monooxygenase